MYCQGGTYDLNLANVELYVERCRHIMDRALYGEGVDPTKVPKLAVFIDCRAHAGLACRPATTMVGYFRKLNVILNNHYPGVMKYIVVYSIPTLINMAVSIVKRVLSKDAAEAIRVLSGNGRDTPKTLKEFVGGIEQIPRWAHRWHEDLYGKIQTIEGGGEEEE